MPLHLCIFFDGMFSCFQLCLLKSSINLWKQYVMYIYHVYLIHNPKKTYHNNTENGRSFLNFQNEPSSSSIRNLKRKEYTLQSKVTSYGWSLLMNVSIDKKKTPRSRFHFFLNIPNEIYLKMYTCKSCMLFHL